MATLGHVAIGMAAGRLEGQRGRRAMALMVVFTAISLLPDADVVAFTLGIPYEHAFGHRGASHSFAAALGLGVLLSARPASGPRDRWGVAALGAIVMASHGLLDALTDGGLGVALLWPFSDARYFAPWRPIPVSPIGARLLSTRGAIVLATEAVLFAPLFAYALWPRRAATPNGSA